MVKLLFFRSEFLLPLFKVAEHENPCIYLSKSSDRTMMVWHRLAASNTMNFVKRQFNRNANNGIRGDSMCRLPTDELVCGHVTMAHIATKRMQHTRILYIYICVWYKFPRFGMQRKSEVIFLISSFVLSSTFIWFAVTLPMLDIWRACNCKITSIWMENYRLYWILCERSRYRFWSLQNDAGLTEGGRVIHLNRVG